MGHESELMIDVGLHRRSRKLLDDLNDFENDTNYQPPSAILEKKNIEKKKKKEEKEKIENEEYSDEWASLIMSFNAPKTKKKKKSSFSGFDLGDGEKKKKKKDKKGNLTNYKKEFEPEMNLLRNLQMDQSKFVDSLQKKYDQFENTKSTARGVGKFTTDLINSITSARSVSLQLVNQIISTKKTIADLEFKEKKEFSSNSTSEQQNMSNYASTYLKQVMSAGRNNLVSSNTISDSDNYESLSEDDDDIFDSINESLGESDRSDDVEKYLKYENDNVKISVIYNDDLPQDSDDKYHYVAHNGNGEELYDYPLPEKNTISINRNTMKATDMYGNKYDLIIV